MPVKPSGVRVRVLPPRGSRNENSQSFVVHEAMEFETVVERVRFIVETYEFTKRISLTSRSLARCIQVVDADRGRSETISTYNMDCAELCYVLSKKFPLLKTAKKPENPTPGKFDLYGNEF